jgi:hypothetical protein
MAAHWRAMNALQATALPEGEKLYVLRILGV